MILDLFNSKKKLYINKFNVLFTYFNINIIFEYFNFFEIQL